MGVIVAIATLAITMVVGFARIMLRLGELQQQLALVWAWYLIECGPGVPGGRRRTDPPGGPLGVPPAPGNARLE